jgi:hypothetical protein
MNPYNTESKIHAHAMVLKPICTCKIKLSYWLWGEIFSRWSDLKPNGSICNIVDEVKQDCD